jgi:hypothetical protein
MADPVPEEITYGSAFVHTTLRGIAGPATASGQNGLMHYCVYVYVVKEL